jgi:hypothetical protein
MSQKLRGSFEIDGETIYEGLYPSISLRLGLVLYRKNENSNGELTTDPDGPHFCFDQFRPYLITTGHSLDEIRSSPKYTMKGPHLGGIWRSGGYIHGDRDSLARRVVMVDLSLTYSRHSVFVELKGLAGPVIPGNGSSSKAQLDFRVWFELPVTQILDIAPDCGQVGLDTLMRNLEHL